MGEAGGGGEQSYTTGVSEAGQLGRARALACARAIWSPWGHALYPLPLLTSFLTDLSSKWTVLRACEHVHSNAPLGTDYCSQILVPFSLLT